MPPCQMLAVVEEDVAEAVVAELFHVTAEGLQNLAQWLASRHPLEHLHFGGKQSLRPFQIHRYRPGT